MPIGKKYFLKGNGDYKNIYTFDGYYSYDAYKEIKKIVKNMRVLSIGLDPMVAVMNNIKTIDGLHTCLGAPILNFLLGLQTMAMIL